MTTKTKSEISRAAASKRYNEEHKNDPEYKAKKSEASRRHYERNKNKVIQQSVEWRLSNADRYKEIDKKCRETRENRDMMEYRLKKQLSGSKTRAKKRGLEFNLDYEYLLSIVNTHCPIFGYELDYTHQKNNEFSAELDRVNNSLGYIKGNICFISRRANRLKNNSSIDELEKIIEYMKSHQTLINTTTTNED